MDVAAGPGSELFEMDEHKPVKSETGPVSGHDLPYPVSRLAPAISLVDVAREIERADEMVALRTEAKLQVIAERIRSLQDEARHILEQAGQDQELHRAECGFRKIPGQVYHLYRRSGGSLHFSMLSPDDWQEKPPHEFVGSFRLENDMSWFRVSSPGKN